MSKAKELYKKTKGLDKEKRDQAIADFAKEVGEDEFVKQILEFADDTQQELKELSQDTIRCNTKAKRRLGK